MDFRLITNDLEQVCADFQVPATRCAAEKQIEELGRRPDAIELGKYVLTNTSVSTAKFFALKWIKASIIDGYAAIGLENTITLRDELLHLATTSKSSDLESFVLDTLCWVIATITKRTWVDSSDQLRSMFIQILCTDVARHSVPCIGIITTTYLLEEMAGGSKCSEFHLPWEFHYSCKVSFEQGNYLMSVFEASLKVLHGQLQGYIGTRNAALRDLGKSRGIMYERRSALHIADRVLNWSFTSPDANKVISSSFGHPGNLKPANGDQAVYDGEGDDDINEQPGQAILDDGDQYRTPQFPQTWKSVLLDKDVIDMFFAVYEATVNDQMHAHFSPGSSHLALQCMIQVSGFRGKGLFSGDKDTSRVQYAQIIMKNQLQMLRQVCLTNNLAADGSEDIVIGTTQMIRRFIESQLDEPTETTLDGQDLHSLALLATGVPETLEYFNEVCKFMCMLLHAASGLLQSGDNDKRPIDEVFDDMDNYFVMQAFDELVSAWSATVNEVKEWECQYQFHRDGNNYADGRSVLSLFLQFLTSTGYMIKSEYFQLRMLICEDVVHAKDCASEVLTINQGMLGKDYMVYEDQLQFIALLARLDIPTTAKRMHECLSSRCSALQAELKRQEDNSSGDTAKSQWTIDILHEQIHWIVLLAGHMLADSGTSERVLIPKSVLAYSMTCKSVEQDYVVQTIMSMLNLLQFELCNSSSSLEVFGSPLLIETLFWALRRLSPVYMLCDASDYPDSAISPTIIHTFGGASQSGNGAAVIDGILDLAKRTFDIWSSEEDVLQMCIDMLLAFAQRSNIAQAIVQSAKFRPLIQYLTSNMHRLPKSTHSSIIEALVVLCCHSTHTEHEQMFGELRQLVLANIDQIIRDPLFERHCQDGRIINRLLDGLDMLDGMLTAANFRNMEMVFDTLFLVQPMLEGLLSMYTEDQGVSLRVIQVIESAARYLDISSLPDDEHMVNCSVNIRSLLEKYQKPRTATTSHDGTNGTGGDLDMDTLSELATLISALSHLIHNEMGFASDEMSTSMSKQVVDSFGETEVFGLYCIHTTATPSQLITPKVLRAYMQLLSDFTQYRTPSLLRWVPAAIWKDIMSMLLEGVNNDIYDVGRRTYETINKLGAYFKTIGTANLTDEVRQTFHIGFKHLLSKLLRALLFSPFNTDLVELAGAALITLGLIDPDHLRQCYQELPLQNNSNGTNSLSERLTQAFAKFNEALETSDAIKNFLDSAPGMPTPIDGAALRQPLFEFLVNTRAVLRVK